MRRGRAAIVCGRKPGIDEQHPPLEEPFEQLVEPNAASTLSQLLAEAQAGERGAKSIPLSVILPNFPITAHPRRSVEF
jgi:hypothetical protein